MDDRQPVFMRIGRVVLASGAVAGAVAGMASILSSGSKRKQTPAGQARTAGTDALRRIENAVPDDARKALRKSLHDAAESSHWQERKSGMKKISRRDGSRVVDQVRGAASEGKEQLGHLTSDALHDAADRLSNSMQDRREAGERARKSLDERRDVADAFRKRMTQESGERMSDLENYLSGTVESRVKPSLAKASENAAHVASDLRTRLRGDLDRLADVAEERRPQIAGAAEQVSGRIRHLLKEADASSDEWRDTAEHALHDAEQVVQDNASLARRLAGDAGESAREGSKSFASLLFWLTVAGALIYAVLLNEEQKRKSREVASATWHEGRELYQDIRGRNAEFES